jgi:hypothetical protein
MNTYIWLPSDNLPARVIHGLFDLPDAIETNRLTTFVILLLLQLG